MYRLTATFEINLPSRILVSRPVDDDLTYKVKVAEFDIELRLVVEEGWSSQLAGEPHKTFGVNKFLISAARFEDHELPPIIITPEGHRDYSQRTPYFQERLPAYQKAVREVFERAILYFKYSLQQPHQNISLDPQDIQNPYWTDEARQELRTGSVFFVSQIHGLQSLLSEKRFTQDEDVNFTNSLENRLAPSLHEELLSDSQTAYYEGNLRRAILELAISCEILVKQFFFAGNPIASSAFEYFEDKSPSGVKVIDLIDQVAKRAFGSSFKETNRDDYRNMDFLFRCRNKIAHRGELIYRDDGNNLHNVTKDDFVQWWRSLETLRNWLYSYRA